MKSGGVQSICSLLFLKLLKGLPFPDEPELLDFLSAPMSLEQTLFKKAREAPSWPPYASELSTDLSKSRTWRTWILASRTVYGSSTTFWREIKTLNIGIKLKHWILVSNWTNVLHIFLATFDVDSGKILLYTSQNFPFMCFNQILPFWHGGQISHFYGKFNVDNCPTLLEAWIIWIYERHMHMSTVLLWRM